MYIYRLVETLDNENTTTYFAQNEDGDIFPLEKFRGDLYESTITGDIFKIVTDIYTGEVFGFYMV